MISWFGGDFRFFWPENMSFLSHVPSAWDSSLNTGIGMPAMNTLWVTSYLNLTAYFSHLGMSWNVISLLFWVLPFLTLSFLSSLFLFKFLINKNNFFSILAGIIYTTNTYFLSIFFGGQVGVCFAYAFVPLVVLFFVKLFEEVNLYRSLFFGLIFSLEFFFDPRFALLTLILLGLYYLLRFRFNRKDIIYLAIVPAVLTILLNGFWIFPTLLFRENTSEQFGAAYTSLQSVKFFSFATFENSLSLLHPNWPDNVFGKVYFMRPEFLLFPILAFSSLLFISRKLQSKAEQSAEKRTVLFFALLGLIGAFLAKGANDPFGTLYLWMFAHVPGFVLFRDSTKFYVLVALAYSILIPFSLLQIAKNVKEYTSTFNTKVLFSILFIIFWVFSLRLLVTTNLWKSSIVPESYVQLKDFIVLQHQFFRTLWIPSWQRYGYFSDLNPAIGRGELFKEASASGMIKALNKKGSEKQLQELGVKYVIVPDDSKGEIFLDDRKYSEKEYRKTMNGIEKIPWLTRVKILGKIGVFEVPNVRDRFWDLTNQQDIAYSMISPTHYQMFITNAKKGDRIIFSDSFDPYWVAKDSGFKIQSSKFPLSDNNRIAENSFVLPENGSYSLDVYYEPQRFVEIGLWVSGITTILLIGYLMVRRKKV